MENIPKILKLNPILETNQINVVKNLAIITQFVITLKSNFISFKCLHFLTKALSSLLLLKTIGKTQKIGILNLLEKFLINLHLEFKKIELEIKRSIKLIKSLFCFIASIESNDKEVLSQLTFISIFFNFFFWFFHSCFK